MSFPELATRLVCLAAFGYCMFNAHFDAACAVALWYIAMNLDNGLDVRERREEK